MGVVYRAWDPQLERSIAIKVVKHASEAMRSRLVREAQSLARLSHRNVCQVYDVGTENDEVWVAMELIEGRTLRGWAEGKDTTAIVDALVAAAEGLGAAHAAGLVHRDVKPENVLVAKDGRAVVTDFGLARVDDHVDAVGSTISGDPNATAVSVAQYATAAGAIAGTPAYLSPEQLTGAPLDARVDQFAWAVMAWELVTGIGPFPVVPGARLDAIRAGITPPASMPKQLGAVLARALSAAPRDRFPSMRELIDALAAKPASKIPRLYIAGVALVFLVGVSIGVWQAVRDHDPPPNRHEPIAIATPDAQLVIEPDAAIVTVAIDAAPLTPPAPPVDAAVIAKKVRTVDAAVTNAVVVPAVPVDAAVVAETTDENTPLRPDEFPPNKPGIMENLFETMCTIPADPTAKGLDMNNDLDWGRITRRTTAISVMEDKKRDLLLYELKGQRATYRFDGWISHIGALHADVGDLVVVCPMGRTNSVWPSPAGWENTVPMEAFLRVTAPPAIAKLARLAPKHIRSMTPSREITNRALEHPADGHYFLRSKAVKQSVGTRWEMEGGWFLDVPATTPGAKDMSTTRMWFVITGGHFDGDALIYRADAVIAQMFPQ